MNFEIGEFEEELEFTQPIVKLLNKTIRFGEIITNKLVVNYVSIKCFCLAFHRKNYKGTFMLHLTQPTAMKYVS